MQLLRENRKKEHLQHTIRKKFDNPNIIEKANMK